MCIPSKRIRKLQGNINKSYADDLAVGLPFFDAAAAAAPPKNSLWMASTARAPSLSDTIKLILVLLAPWLIILTLMPSRPNTRNTCSGGGGTCLWAHIHKRWPTKTCRMCTSLIYYMCINMKNAQRILMHHHHTRCHTHTTMHTHCHIHTPKHTLPCTHLHPHPHPHHHTRSRISLVRDTLQMRDTIDMPVVYPTLAMSLKSDTSASSSLSNTSLFHGILCVWGGEGVWVRVCCERECDDHHPQPTTHRPTTSTAQTFYRPTKPTDPRHLQPKHSTPTTHKILTKYTDPHYILCRVQCK